MPSTPPAAKPLKTTSTAAERRVKRIAYPLLTAGLVVMTFGFATGSSAKSSNSGAKVTPAALVASATSTPAAQSADPLAAVSSTPAGNATVTPDQSTVAPPGSTPAAASADATSTATPAVATPATPPPATPTPRPPTPKPTVAPGSSTGSASMASLEADLYAAHNLARTGANVPALVLDPKLVTIARARAEDMAARNYFSHSSPGGDTAFSLLGQASYVYTIAAENIARNNYPDSQAVSVAMDGFLNSPSHKENIVDPRFKNVGIGVASGADGMKYFAVIFAG